jgi:hypothetical protein
MDLLGGVGMKKKKQNILNEEIFHHLNLSFENPWCGCV